jgi:hypothetical protein
LGFYVIQEKRILLDGCIKEIGKRSWWDVKIKSNLVSMVEVEEYKVYMA